MRCSLDYIIFITKQRIDNQLNILQTFSRFDMCIGNNFSLKEGLFIYLFIYHFYKITYSYCTLQEITSNHKKKKVITKKNTRQIDNLSQAFNFLLIYY